MEGQVARAGGPAAPKRAARGGWLVAAALLAVVVLQEIRWQMSDPFELAAVSHAVGVPAGEALTAGYAIRNTSRLPLSIEGIAVPGDAHTRGDGTTVRLDVMNVAATPRQTPSAAKRGGALELGLSTSRVDGQGVAPGEQLALAVTYRGTGPDRFSAGPLIVRYGFGPWEGEQRVSLGRGYRIVVTGPDPTPAWPVVPTTTPAAEETS